MLSFGKLNRTLVDSIAGSSQIATIQVTLNPVGPTHLANHGVTKAEPFIQETIWQGKAPQTLAPERRRAEKTGESGAGYEVRTRDIQLGKLTLYQLS